MEQEHVSPHGGEEQHKSVQRQEQQPHGAGEHAAGQAAERHAGQGSESAMKQLRAWEQHRVTLSGGKRRDGPN